MRITGGNENLGSGMRFKNMGREDWTSLKEVSLGSYLSSTSTSNLASILEDALNKCSRPARDRHGKADVSCGSNTFNYTSGAKISDIHTKSGYQKLTTTGIYGVAQLTAFKPRCVLIAIDKRNISLALDIPHSNIENY